MDSATVDANNTKIVLTTQPLENRAVNEIQLIIFYTIWFYVFLLSLSYKKKGK